MILFYILFILHVSLVFSASSATEPDEVRVLQYNVKSGKDFLGQTCCWDVPQVTPGSEVPKDHIRMKEFEWMMGLLHRGEVEAIMAQETVDGKADPANSRCSDLSGMVAKANAEMKSNIGVVYAGDSLAGENKKPGFIPGFNCAAIFYNKDVLEVIPHDGSPMVVGYGDFPNRDNNQIPKNFPQDAIPIAMGTTSDKEDRFFASWLFSRMKENAIVSRVIMVTGNWPNSPKGKIAEQKAANGITPAGMPDATGEHLQALLTARDKYSGIPIIMGMDFNNEHLYVKTKMVEWAAGKVSEELIAVSEDLPTCCPDIVRNHGEKQVIPKRNAEGKPNGEFEFKPREGFFPDLKPFQGNDKFAFDHVACVGCDSIWVNGPLPTKNAVIGPFGWTPFTVIPEDPEEWWKINSAEHAPMAGLVIFNPPGKAKGSSGAAPPKPPLLKQTARSDVTKPDSPPKPPLLKQTARSDVTKPNSPKAGEPDDSKPKGAGASSEDDPNAAKRTSKEASKDANTEVAESVLTKNFQFHLLPTILFLGAFSTFFFVFKYVRRKYSNYKPLLDEEV